MARAVRGTPVQARLIHVAAVCGLIVLVLLLTAPRALAQGQVRVRSAMSDSRVQLGDSAIYQIIVEGSTDAGPPAITPVPGLSIEYAGASNQPAPVYIVNGVRQDTGPDRYILSYRVTPLRTGEFTIPGPRVAVGGVEYPVDAVRLIVSEPPPDTGSILEVSTSSASAYVGETITVTLSWYFLADVRGVSFSSLAQSPGYDLLPGPDPRPAGTRAGDPRYQALTLDGREVLCTVSRTIRAGREYGVVSLVQTLVPTRSGEIEIGPFAATAQVKVGERQLGVLLTEDVVERRVSRSEPVAIQVQDLPTQGRPPGFSGLVGRFGVQASASPTRVNVGDPIELQIEITGHEPLSRVDAPDLSRMPGFTGSFRLSPDGVRATTQQQEGTRRFTTTIRATSQQVQEIPPVELSYFDTATGEYRVARSDAIPLVVQAAREVTASDAIGGDRIHGMATADPPDRPSTAVPLSRVGRGPLAVTVTPDALRDESGDVWRTLSSPGWAALALLPPAACLASVAYRASRHAGSGAAARRRAAGRRAVAMLRSPRADVGQAVRMYAAACLDMPAHAVTAFDVRRWGEQETDASSREATARLGDILTRAESASLGGPEPVDLREAIRAIKACERGARP